MQETSLKAQKLPNQCKAYSLVALGTNREVESHPGILRFSTSP